MNFEMVALSCKKPIVQFQLSVVKPNCNRHRQSNEPIRTRSRYDSQCLARENARGQVAIGLASNCLIVKSGAITKRSNAKPK